MKKSNARERWSHLALYVSNAIIDSHRARLNSNDEFEIVKYSDEEKFFTSILQKMIEIEKEFPLVKVYNKSDFDLSW